MKKISFLVLILICAVSLARAQDTATQQQLDKLSATIQDMQASQDLQRQRIDALEKEITELRDKVNTPVINNSASVDDLKKLAEQVQEIDQKRQDDRKLILEQIENLSKVATAPPVAVVHHEHPVKPATEEGTTVTTSQNGYDYVIKQGDTLGLIIKAFHDKGVKVTMKQIVAANPNLNPDVLIPGKKIFIPDASAK